jgi:ABC-type sugar transport system ATPase subunit
LRFLNSGIIKIKSHDITNCDPRLRNIGYVPQEGALFDHLTVEENLSFSLVVAGFKKLQIRNIVDDLADMLSITDLKKRQIRGLSGGERQRVALGRAIANSPSAMLFDEPVSALDEYTREIICNELVSLQKKLSIPVIHVCHSVEEASLVSSRVAIMQKGIIIQTGTLEELQKYPKNRYVAGLLRIDNVFEGNCIGAGNQFLCNGIVLHGLSIPKGKFFFVVRPWEFKVACENDLVNRIEGTVTGIRFVGPCVKITITLSFAIKLVVSRQEFYSGRFIMGQRICITFPLDAIWVLPE